MKEQTNKTIKNNFNTSKSGSDAEQMAIDFLIKKNFKIIKKNFRLGKYGEIDIIAHDGDYLVFIEVKSRSNSDFGSPEEAVNTTKQRQIRRIAESYLYVNKITDANCRFDVVAINFKGNSAEIRHIVNAF